MRPTWLRKDAWIQRKPCGYYCRVVKVDDERQEALIHDRHRGCSFWVSYGSLVTRWKGAAS